MSTEHIPASEIRVGDKVGGLEITRLDQSGWGEGRIYGYTQRHGYEDAVPFSWYPEQYVFVERAPKPFDTVGFIMAVEGGEVTVEEYLTGMSHMVRSGTVWQLQGSWGRAAAGVIEQGALTEDGEITEHGRALIERDETF